MAGFVIGVLIFVVLSALAPPVHDALSPDLCRIHPPEQRFPGFGCLLISALMPVLWLGPVGAALPLLGAGPVSLPLVRAGSGCVMGLMGAILFGRMGRRRGLLAFLGISGALLLIFTAAALTLVMAY